LHRSLICSTFYAGTLTFSVRNYYSTPPAASREVDIYILTDFCTIAHALFLFDKITRRAKPLGILVYVKDFF
jgi:hypothetical protein